MGNYELARDRAQAYFLNYDQKAIIKKWKLQNDPDRLFVDFLGRPYAIYRNSGRIDRIFDGKQAGFTEALSIFDLLCHENGEQFITGDYATVNSLRGCPVSVGVDTPFYEKTAAKFEREFTKFREACIKLGGTPVDMGDVGFLLPVFGPLSVVLKFYHSDDEFPASLTFLWEENSLAFMYYETVFYVAGFVLESICELMGAKENL